MIVTVKDLHLWAAQQVGGDFDAIWDFLNKITLGPTDSDWDYWCDPVNVDTFAETGMDGAHFGEFDASDGQRPVVLVSLAVGEQWCCMILGASLHEFLCLGCEVGYGLLVELPVQAARATSWIQEGRAASSEQAQILHSLRSEFSLTPWPDVGTRLFELQELYLDELDMPG